MLKRGRAVGSWAEAGGQLLKIVYNLLNTAVFADGESAAAALEQLVEFVQQVRRRFTNTFCIMIGSSLLVSVRIVFIPVRAGVGWEPYV